MLIPKSNINKAAKVQESSIKRLPTKLTPVASIKRTPHVRNQHVSDAIVPKSKSTGAATDINRKYDIALSPQGTAEVPYKTANGTEVKLHVKVLNINSIGKELKGMPFDSRVDEGIDKLHSSSLGFVSSDVKPSNSNGVSFDNTKLSSDIFKKTGIDAVFDNRAGDKSTYDVQLAVNNKLTNSIANKDTAQGMRLTVRQEYNESLSGDASNGKKLMPLDYELHINEKRDTQSMVGSLFYSPESHNMQQNVSELTGMHKAIMGTMHSEAVSRGLEGSVLNVHSLNFHAAVRSGFVVAEKDRTSMSRDFEAKLNIVLNKGRMRSIATSGKSNRENKGLINTYHEKFMQDGDVSHLRDRIDMECANLPHLKDRPDQNTDTIFDDTIDSMSQFKTVSHIKVGDTIETNVNMRKLSKMKK